METNNYFIKKVVNKYMAPTIGAILGTTVVGFINNLLTGAFWGKDALAAAGVVSSFTFLFAMVGCLICIGGAVAGSICIGEGDNERYMKYAYISLVLTLVISIILAVVLTVFLHPIFISLGASEKLYSTALVYARITLLCGPFSALIYYPFNFLRIDGRANLSMIMIVIMAVVDIILDIIFINLHVGIWGIALSIAIASLAADIVGIYILFKGRGSEIRLVRASIKETLSSFRWIAYYGSSSALTNFCSVIRTLAINAILLKYVGQDAVAIFAVIGSIITFANASISGSGQTITPLVGVFFGEKDYPSIRMLINTTIKSAMIIHVGLAVALIILAYPISYLFGIKDALLAAECAYAIRLISVSFIPAAYLSIYIYYYMTAAKSVLSNLLTFLRSFLLVVIFAKIIVAFGGAELFYLAFIFAELMDILVLVLIAKIRQYKNPDIQGLLYINKKDLENGEYLSFSVRSDDSGASEASSKIADFCEEHCRDLSIATTLPMALEEILVIFNNHALDGIKDAYEDVRIFINDESAVLRIRCDGTVFDPIRWYRDKIKNMSPEDLLMDESLGMKMITKKAKSIDYLRTFGVNNLVIEIESASNA